MSSVSISYRGLDHAANEAKTVAKRLDQYADELYDKVYRKLNKYDGKYRDEVYNANVHVKNKIEQLNADSQRQANFSANLKDLKEECISVDKAVRTRISDLSKSFKESHGIRDSKIEYFLEYLFAEKKNGSAFGRYLSKIKDRFDAEKEYLKDAIKEWYNFHGGKQFKEALEKSITDTVLAVITIALAVIAIIHGAAGLALAAAIAGIILGVINIVDAVNDIVQEKKAYDYEQAHYNDENAKNYDPALSKRLGNINTLRDWLRSSFKYGDDGQTYRSGLQEELSRFAAGMIDFTALVCSVIKFTDGAKNLLTKGFKFFNQNNIHNIKDLGSYIKFRFDNILGAINGGYGKLVFRDLKLDVLKNLKSHFSDFTDNQNKFSLKDTLNSIKNIISFPKDLLNKGVIESGIKNILLPSITVFNFNEIINGDSSSQNVTLDEFSGLFDKSNSLIQNVLSGLDQMINNMDLKLPDMRNMDRPISKPLFSDLNLGMYGI